MILSRLAIGPRFNKKLYKKIVCIFLYLSLESLSMYEHFRTKLLDFIRRNWR